MGTMSDSLPGYLLCITMIPDYVLEVKRGETVDSYLNVITICGIIGISILMSTRILNGGYLDIC